MNLFTVSWKNLWHKPWTTILSILLVVFGVGLLTVLILFQKQFQEQFDRNQAGIDLVVGAKGSPLQLILNSMFHVDAPTGNIKIEDARFLFNKKNPYIQDAIPLSVGDSYQTYRIVGTNKDILKLYPTKIASGTLWEAEMDVVIGAEVAQVTGLKLGETFSSSHGFNPGDLEHDDVQPFKVKGILEGHGSVIDKLILCSSESVWAVHSSHDHESDEHDHSNDEASHDHNHTAHPEKDSFDANKIKSFLDFPEKSISSVLVRFNPNKKKTIPVINMPRNINENTPLMASSPTYQLNKLIANLATALKGLGYLAFLIGFISALSIFISLYNNLKERRQEMAMMRVSGATPVQLFLMILYEALIIAIIGSVIGLILAHLGLAIISSLLDNQFHYTLESLQIYKEEIYILLATIGIAIAAGLIPAWKAYSTDIIKNLK